MRTQSSDVESMNDKYIAVAAELDNSDAGTLNLSACPPNESGTKRTLNALLQKSIIFRDKAEQLQAENRRLRAEMSEKVEAVRNFWRNSVLEERTRSGRMVMLSLRSNQQYS